MKIVKINPCLRSLMALIGISLLQCCAPLTISRPSPPFDSKEIADIVFAIREQDSAVRTLFSSGRLTFLGQASESDATILIVGTRDPSRIKIEITHPWGRPLLHILVDGPRIDILSFSEKRLYYGRLGSLGLSSLLPVRLDLSHLWILARCYPGLKGYDRAISLKGGQITLLSETGEKTEVIDLIPGSLLPRMVSFPEQNTRVRFSDFEDDDGILYAREMRLIDPEDETRVVLDIRRMVFNNPVPEEIFKLVIPADFEAVHLQ